MLRSYINILEVYSIVDAILAEDFNQQTFLSRAKGVQALINRGASEGEKSAARAAMERMVAKAEAALPSMSPGERESFQRAFALIRSATTQDAERARPRRPNPAEPPPRPRRDQADADAEYARRQQSKQEEKSREDTGGASALTVVMYAEFRAGTSDKVYGVVRKGASYFTFWGRNGGSLATKPHTPSEAISTFRSKINKGYIEKAITPAVQRTIERSLRFK